jgi:hypothetical protein
MRRETIILKRELFYSQAELHGHHGMDQRVTEDGMRRITELGELRVIEPTGGVDVTAQTVADAVALLRQQGQRAEVRLTTDEATVIAFDGTEVRIATEITGSMPA